MMTDFDTGNPKPPPSLLERRNQAVVQIDDLASNGEIVAVEPDIAELMAAFIEDALSIGDAITSNLDVDMDSGFVSPGNEKGETS